MGMVWAKITIFWEDRHVNRETVSSPRYMKASNCLKKGFWSPDANSQLIGKIPDAGKD